MKYIIASLLVACAALTAQAVETTAKITNVHLCCPSCVKGVEKAVGTVKGVSATVDKDAESVTLTGPDKATLQKAADALVAAGFFGKPADDTVKLSSESGAKGAKVQSVKVEGVHLCCGKCVGAVDKAVKSVSGVKEHTATKNADSFEVTGNFNDKALFEALHKAGLGGHAAK